MNLSVSFRDAPIKRKLMLISLLISGIALFFISSVLTARGWIEWRTRTVSDMATYARIIGTNATSALLFDDRNAAVETLSALSANPDIIDAVIYDRKGKMFARFVVPRHSPDAPMPQLKPGSFLFSFDQLVVSEPILSRGEVLGSIYLESDPRDLYTDILRDTGLTFIAALGVFLVSIFLFIRMQKIIVDPIMNLSGKMREVSEKQDYAVRVAVHGRDEVGILARTFNDMLERIQQRDDELAQHRTHLEEVVAQRTAELSDANRLLEHELAERKQAEEHIRESEARYRGIFEYANDIIYLLEPDGAFRSLSPAFERITGWKIDEWIGKPFAPILHPEDLPHANKIFKRALDGESTPSFRLRIARKSGEYFDADLSITPLGREAVTGMLGIARDVTERRLMEEEIRKLNEELEIKVQERTQQLLEAQEELVRKEKLAVLGQVAGSVGHELRNPLGVMNNAVYFLQAVLSDADETVKEYLNIIRNEVAGSERIVSDLLDSVRTKPPHPEMVGVAQLIEQVLRKCAIPPSVTVRLDIPAAIPPLRVDGMQIHQVLRNLVTNGVEAMPEGGTLEIRVAEGEAAKNLTISVRDTGVGITQEQLEHLFQPLYTTKARGIGLGLVVVKNLTEANGGSIEVQSEAGKGSTFLVTLPAGSDIVETA